MKNPVIRILLHMGLLVAIIFVGDRFGAWMIDRAVMSTQFRYSQLYKGQMAADVVVIGNSRALHMLHPPAIREVSERETASISFNALPSVLMPALWHDYLQNHTPPKTLLYEISCVSHADESGALERFTTYMSHSKTLAEAIAEHRPREYWASEASHLYRFNGEFAVRSMFFRKRSDQAWIMQETVTSERIDRILASGVEEIVYSQQYVNAAREVLSLAAAHDVEVQLIVGPFHPRYRAAIPELSAWINWLHGQLDRPIHDYSQAITENAAFADHMHLNASGALQFARTLHNDGIL